MSAARDVQRAAAVGATPSEVTSRTFGGSFGGGTHERRRGGDRTSGIGRGRPGNGQGLIVVGSLLN